MNKIKIIRYPVFSFILKNKRKEYGQTEAAIEFSAEEYAEQYAIWHELYIPCAHNGPYGHAENSIICACFSKTTLTAIECHCGASYDYGKLITGDTFFCYDCNRKLI